jgi:hypothetical protein
MVDSEGRIMRIGSLILGFVVGAVATYLISLSAQIVNAVSLAEVSGKVAFMQEVCPSLVEKSGVVKKK